MSSCGVYQCQEVEEYCDNVLHVCTACRDICPYPYDIEEHRPQIVDCENFCPEYSKKLYGESTPTTTGVTVALAVTTAPTPAGLSTALIAGTVVSVILAGISLIALGICCIHRFRRKAHHRYGNYHEPDRYDSSSVKPLHERPSNQDEEHLSLGGNPITQVSDGEQHSCNILPSVTIENDSLVRLNLHGPDSPGVDFVGATAAAIHTPVQTTKPSEASTRPIRPAVAHPTAVPRDRALAGIVDNGNSPTSTPPPPVRSNTAEAPPGRVSNPNTYRNAVTSLVDEANHAANPGRFVRSDTRESELCLRSTFPGEATDDVTGQAQATLPVEESVVSLENNTERWQMVMKMYDGIDANMHRLPFVRGCLVGSDALQVYVLGDDVDSYYNQIRNVLPSDPLVQELLIVQPE